MSPSWLRWRLSRPALLMLLSVLPTERQHPPARTKWQSCAARGRSNTLAFTWSCYQHGLTPRTAHQTIGKECAVVPCVCRSLKGDFDLERVGEYPVRGFNDPIERF